MGRLRYFCIAFVPAFALCAVAYFYALGPYTDLVHAPANQLLAGPLCAQVYVKARDRSQPIYLRVDRQPDGKTWMVKQVKPEKGETQAYYAMREGTNHLLFLGSALLPALLLATPMRWRWRLLLVPIGLAVLYAFHVTAIIVLIRTYVQQDPKILQLAGLEEAPVYVEILRAFFRRAGQFFAFVLWAAFTWRFWFASRASAPE